MTPTADSDRGFEMQMERRDAAQVITVEGELDMGSADRVAEALGQAQEELADQADGPEAIVLDLSRLTFMDSTGLRMILEADLRLSGCRPRLEIVPGPRPVQRVFELTGTAELLPFRAVS